MHSHQMAHLDISMHNILTDYQAHYAFIDFECCRRFDGTPAPLIRGIRGTDVPPEVERGDWADPYKADVWMLAVLIHRACKVCELWLGSTVNPLLTPRDRLLGTTFPNWPLSPGLCFKMTTVGDRVQRRV